MMVAAIGALTAGCMLNRVREDFIDDDRPNEIHPEV